MSCCSNDTTLINCSHRTRDHRYYCHYGGDAGVSCQLQVKNITAATIQTLYNNYTMQNILLSWELYINVSNRPHSFSVECSDQQHHNIEMLVNNGSLMQINIGDLLSFTSFVCCVSAVYYYGHYEIKLGRKCTSTDSETPSDLFTTSAPNQTTDQLFTMNSSSVIPTSVGPERVASSGLNMRASIITGAILGFMCLLNFANIHGRAYMYGPLS